MPVVRNFRGIPVDKSQSKPEDTDAAWNAEDRKRSSWTYCLYQLNPSNRNERASARYPKRIVESSDHHSVCSNCTYDKGSDNRSSRDRYKFSMLGSQARPSDLRGPFPLRQSRILQSFCH